jgi:hypothetical protein
MLGGAGNSQPDGRRLAGCDADRLAQCLRLLFAVMPTEERHISCHLNAARRRRCRLRCCHDRRRSHRARSARYSVEGSIGSDRRVAPESVQKSLAAIYSDPFGERGLLGPPEGFVVQGPDRCLRAILDTNFAKYGLDVNLHSGLGDTQPISDDLVRRALH